MCKVIAILIQIFNKYYQYHSTSNRALPTITSLISQHCLSFCVWLHKCTDLQLTTPCSSRCTVVSTGWSATPPLESLVSKQSSLTLARSTRLRHWTIPVGRLRTRHFMRGHVSAMQWLQWLQRRHDDGRRHTSTITAAASVCVFRQYLETFSF